MATTGEIGISPNIIDLASIFSLPLTIFFFFITFTIGRVLSIFGQSITASAQSLFRFKRYELIDFIGNSKIPDYVKNHLTKISGEADFFESLVGLLCFSFIQSLIRFISSGAHPLFLILMLFYPLITLLLIFIIRLKQLNIKMVVDGCEDAQD